MTREAWTWCGLAVLSLLWCGLSAGSGSLVVPALAAGVCLACAADRRARARVAGFLGHAFAGPVWRTGLIMVGALLLIQLLPLELGLLLAGDVLAYVEAAAAVSLIAANTRLKPLIALARRRLQDWLAPLRRPHAGAPRAARPVRPPRKPAPADDADGRGWALA